MQTDSQATLGHLFNQYFGKGRQDLLAEVMLQIDNPVFWEILDYATILFEIGFLIAVFHPRTTKLFISFAVLFHFSIMMMMNISFLTNFVAYAAFLNWTAIHATLKGWVPGKWTSPVLLTVFFSVIGIIILLAGNYGIPTLESDLKIQEFVVLMIAVPVAVTFVVRQFKAFRLRATEGGKSFKAGKL